MQQNNLRRFVPILVGLVGIFFFAAKGCEEGPFGRRRIVTISPEDELALGIQSFQEVLSKSREIRGEAINDVVTNIGRRIARVAESPEFKKKFGMRNDQRFEWEFRVVQDRQINAFCLPGGKVVVFTGILPVAETEAGLAVVMGHEIGHALARHGAERMAQTQLAQLGVTAVGVGVSDMDPGQRQMIMAALTGGTKLGLLSYSRKHESEADHIGILLMAAAGYDPRVAPRFWERMGKAAGGGGQPPEFLSTHPNHETRIRDLEAWTQDEAYPIYERTRDKVTDRPLPMSGERPGGPTYQQSRPRPVEAGRRPGYQFK